MEFAKIIIFAKRYFGHKGTRNTSFLGLAAVLFVKGFPNDGIHFFDFFF